MKLAFYKVDNSLGFDRHSFDDMSAEQIELHLQPLLNDDNEAAIVNLDDDESIEYFTEEYNDEVYDLGWWCVTIPDYQTEEEKQAETAIRDEYNRISENEGYVHIDDMTAFAKDVLVDILDDERQDDNVCYDFEDELHQELQNLIVRLGVKYKNKIK